jgi:signal transduction histidine kinase
LPESPGFGDTGAEMDPGSDELRRALAREKEKLQALREIGAALGSTLDLNELLVLVLDRVSNLMEADRSTLYLLDDDTGELWSKVAQGEDVREIRLKVGEGLSGWVAKTGRLLNIKDVYQDPRFDSTWDKLTGYRTRSALVVPLKNQHGRIIGVIQVLNKVDGSFTADDEHMLAALASQAAVSIENSKLFLSVVGKNMELLETKEALERKVRELDVLFEIAQVSASALELDDLLEGILARTMRAIDAEAASILLADEQSSDLRFRAAVGGEPEAVRKLRIKAGQGISGWVAMNQKSQVVNDVSKDPRHSRDLADRVGYHPRSVLCVPLQWEHGTGALELLNKTQGLEPFTDDDVKLATVIAGHVSTAIGNARRRAVREREERLSTIGQFLSGVLHDLKTPMTVIHGYVQLLADEPDTELRRTYAGLVQRQVELINMMTRETLAFARGDRKLWVRKVYLHKYFADVVDQLQRELAERKIHVALRLDDRGVAHFDPHKIQRAIHNLARNAAEATGTDGGEFEIGVARGTDDGLVLTFRDDGPGIPDEIRERLFTPFATHGKHEGTGLGLAIVRQIVEDHRGSIRVESEPGETVFTIELPRLQTASEVGFEAPTAAQIENARERTLR